MPSSHAPGRAQLPVSVSKPVHQERMGTLAEEIAIECVRGQSKVTIRWPLTAAADCGRWLKDWLT